MTDPEALIHRLIAASPQELDLVNAEHLRGVQEQADALLDGGAELADLDGMEMRLVAAEHGAPLGAHVSVKLARSKRLLESIEGSLRVSVVFAVYKESRRIRRLDDDELGEDFLRRKVEQLEWLFGQERQDAWEVVLVDDGCPEQTGHLAEEIIESENLTDRVRVLYLQEAIDAHLPVVRPLQSVDESRKGGSILLGLDRALHQAADRHAAGGSKRHVLIFTDADLSTHLGQCGLLLAPILLDGKAVALASRRESRSVVVKKGQRNTRGKLFIYLWKQMLPILHEITDTQCGFKAFRADLAAQILIPTIEKKFAFDIELLVKAELADPGCLEKVPVAWIDSEALSTTTDIQPYLSMLQAISAMYREYLEPNERSESYANFVEGLDESAWARLVDQVPEVIASGDPSDFGGTELVSLTQLGV